MAAASWADARMLLRLLAVGGPGRSLARRRPPAGGPPPDEELVARAQGGDLDAFEELVRRHRLRVYRVALRMLGQHADAEDATQDTFLQAWRALPQFRGESSLATWLYRVVTTQCLKVLARHHDTEVLDDTLVPGGDDTEQVAEVRAGLAALKAAIATLTPEQRAPWVLRDLEGLPYAEIVAALDLNLPAVKGRIHRARQVLLEAMRSWA